MNKKQQMRWSRARVQPFLDVRTAVLNDTLEDRSVVAIPVAAPRTTMKQLHWRGNEPHRFACSRLVAPEAGCSVCLKLGHG